MSTTFKTIPNCNILKSLYLVRSSEKQTPKWDQLFKRLVVKTPIKNKDTPLLTLLGYCHYLFVPTLGDCTSIPHSFNKDLELLEIYITEYHAILPCGI